MSGYLPAHVGRQIDERVERRFVARAVIVGPPAPRHATGCDPARVLHDRRRRHVVDHRGLRNAGGRRRDDQDAPGQRPGQRGPRIHGADPLALVRLGQAEAVVAAGRRRVQPRPAVALVETGFGHENPVAAAADREERRQRPPRRRGRLISGGDVHEQVLVGGRILARRLTRQHPAFGARRNRETGELVHHAVPGRIAVREPVPERHAAVGDLHHEIHRGAAGVGERQRLLARLVVHGAALAVDGGVGLVNRAGGRGAHRVQVIHECLILPPHAERGGRDDLVDRGVVLQVNTVAEPAIGPERQVEGDMPVRRGDGPRLGCGLCRRSRQDGDREDAGEPDHRRVPSVAGFPACVRWQPRIIEPAPP